MSKIKVLIAEDTPDILELLTDKVKAAGFDVIPARDGLEAIENIRQAEPDIILLDLMMPKLDGFAVLKQLRQNPNSQKWQPVIIVSALSDLENMKKCFNLEAEHYITKPFQPNDIIKGIQRMIKLVPSRELEYPSGLANKKRGDMELLKVLIADDEPDVLAILAKKVAQAGFAVVPARDGQEAWDKIVQEAPDVIVLDLMMPRLDGFSVLKKLRQAPSAKKWQPVIIVSAKNELADMQEGFALEADHYITKPCKPEDVIKGIQLMINLIPQRRTPKELAEER